MGVVDGAMRLIGCVMRGERPEDVIQEDLEDGWERSRAKELTQDLLEGRIKMLTAEETDEAVAALKKKWSR